MTDDDDEGRAFTPAERRALRKMMENEERAAWFWHSARLWAGYCSAAVIGAYAVYQALQGWLAPLFKKVGGP